MSDRIIHSVLTATLLLGLSTGKPIVGGTPARAVRDIYGNGLPKMMEKIVNGKGAEFGAHPYLVAIEYLSESRETSEGRRHEYKHLCGGVILDKTTIVTAAHCFINKTLWGVHPNEYYRIVAAKQSVAQQIIYIPVDSIKEHEGFNGRNPHRHNDIAIIHLNGSNSLRLNRFVDCIELPHPNMCFTGEAEISGWGVIATARGIQLPDSVQDAWVNIFSDQSCSNQWGDDFNPEYMMCAVGDKAVGPVDDYSDIGPYADACWGDSGGPLVVRDQETGKKLLAGLVAYGWECGHNDYPGMYTKVTRHLEWINEATKNSLSCHVKGRNRRLSGSRKQHSHAHGRVHHPHKRGYRALGQ